MNKTEIWMRWLLLMIGGAACLAVVAVVMPQSWLVWCVAHVEPDLSIGFLITYLARSLSSFYVLFGSVCLVFAGDVRRYRAGIKCLAVWLVSAHPTMVIALFLALPDASSQWFFYFAVGNALFGLSASTVLFTFLRKSPIDPESPSSLGDDAQ